MAESVKSTERPLRVVELLTGEASLDFSAICAQLTLSKSSALGASDAAAKHATAMAVSL